VIQPDKGRSFFIMLSKINCIVVPIVSRTNASKPSAFWLWNAWRPATVGGSEPEPSLKRWADGFNLEDKMEIMNQKLSNTMYQKFAKEWRKLEAAKPGTLKNWAYKLAQRVLSREDPRESFLKSVPTDGGILDIQYPDVFPEKLVRRRLRLIARQGRSHHRKGLILWSILLVPQMPLMVTPLPNITVYYTLYRIWSHSRALQGSFVLDHGFCALDAKQLVHFREQLIALQNQGVDFGKDTWTHKLVSGDRTYREFFNEIFILHNKRRLERRLSRMLQESSSKDIENSEEAMQPVETIPPPGHFEILDTGLHLYFAPDSELSKFIKDTEVTDDGIVSAIAERFSVTNLQENVARALLYLKKKRL
jgi:hypothetical protein